MPLKGSLSLVPRRYWSYIKVNFIFKIFALFVGLALANFDESKVGFNLVFILDFFQMI